MKPILGERQHRVLRGGRMTKWKGRAASMSPMLGQLVGSVSPLALALGAAITVSGGGAAAQDICTAAGGGVYNCAGPSTTEQALSVTSGSLTVNLDDTATVDAALGDAFDLRKYGGDGDLTFTQAPGGGAITGASDGISASNVGTGALSITATGAVTGDIDGILTVNFGTDLSITTESDVAGGNSGINATNQTDGALSITATGAVTGTQSFGIYANNRGGTTDVSVTAGSAVLGYISGIYTRNRGTGALEITATETVTGTTGDGIVGRNFGTNLSVTAGAAVLGGDIGIVARNNGTGVLEITTTGAVTGEAGRGIDAYAAASAAGDVTVTARGDVTGAREAILVDNQGSGATIVRAEGTLTGGGGYAALSASSAASGTDMTIEVLDATGSIGIDASHLGTGELTVTATGTVTGTAGDGINASNTTNATDGGVTVNANVVTGGADGIDAYNFGTGVLQITATGAVTGTTGDGIAGRNGYYGTNLSVTAESTVSGGDEGIYAYNIGTGALSITANGAVTGTTGGGILAINKASGLSLTAESTVSGGHSGIFANNVYRGALEITTTGAVTGTTGGGILAINGGTDLSVTAGAAVSGDTYGFFAFNYGTGALEITAAGTVTGTRFDGIQATNEGTDLTITAGGDVTGGMNGIVTDHRGDGALGVTMAGAVTGGTGAGVENAATSQGGQFVLQDGGSIQADSGLAFADLADGSTGDASSTLDIAGALNGDVQMGAGGDTLILRDTATLGAGITLDGDAGAESGIAGQIDRLEFAGWTGSFDAAQALNWESVVLSEDAVVTFADGAAAGTAAGDLTVEIGADATARLAGDFMLDGALANAGLLDLSTAAPSVGTQLRVTGDYSAASDLLIDADLSSGGGTDNTVEGDAAFTDQILIGGNVTGTTTVTMNNTGAGLALTDLDGNGQVDANEGLLFAQAQGSAAADSFVLAAPIIDGAFMAEVYSFGPDASVSGAWDYVLGTVFSPATPGYESLPYTLMGFARARSLASRQGGQQWLVGGAPAGGNGSPETAGGGGARDPGLALAPRRGIWIAAEGSRWDVTPQQSTTGLDFDLDLWRIRAGFETIAMEAASGTMTVGLDFFAGNGTLDAHAEAGSTSTSTDAYGGGLTLTWYGDDGLYADGQLSFVSSDSDISSGTLGTVATGVGGSATVLSVELGKRFGLQSGWTVIPQGQLSWASMSFDSFTGSSGETVTPEDWNSLLLRLGAAAERRWQVESGGQASFYGLANVNHEFNADTTVDVSGTKLTSKLPDWTAELGIGGAYDWNDGRGRLFGEVTVSEALGSGDLSGVSGTLGISLRF
jgi:outer membrane autotransporter protein